MKWARRMLAYLGFPRPERDPDLRRTRPKHVRAIAKADRAYEDFRRMDGALVIRIEKKPR